MKARVIRCVIPITVVAMAQVILPPTAIGDNSDSVFLLKEVEILSE